MTRVSCPVSDWSWPSANCMESRAFWRASAMATELDAERSETDDSVSKPTAMTVSRIIRLSVTTKAKPDFL